MSPAPPPASAGSRAPRRWRLRLLLSGTLLLVLLGGTELVARAVGWRPWVAGVLRVRVRPEGRLFTAHPTLGYSHIPGVHQVTMHTGYTWTTTHGEDTLRITRPPDDTTGRADRPGLWIFGCSFTHGWSLNDADTYPWKLQSRLPDHAVANFGVGGYGTLHSLIQFREALEARPAPAVAVVAYADFHDERSAFLRSRQKALPSQTHLGPLLQPYARLDDEGSLTIAMATVEYTEFPLMRHSAVMHFLEQRWNAHEAASVPVRAISLAILAEFAAEAERHGVRLVVAGISGSEATRSVLAELAGNGQATVDISVDAADPANHNLPHDGHPSAHANDRYTETLHAYLQGEGLLDP